MAAQPDTFTCNGCGASQSYAAGLQALRCEFCDAITPIPQLEPASDSAALLIIPLTVEQKALEHAVLSHLASIDSAPDDLVERARISKVRPFYVPCFDFNGSYTAQWTASFGYDRTESYTDYETHTENGQSRQVAVTKSRTVTDWNAVHGADSGDFEVLGYRGSALPPNAVMVVQQCAALSSKTAFSPGYVSGVEVQPAILNERESYDQHAYTQINAIIDVNIRRHAQGDRQRDWHASATIRSEGTPILVPLCHALIEYQGKQYEVWADGTDPTKLAADSLPVDSGKQGTRVIGFALLVGATLIFLAAGFAADSFLAVFQVDRMLMLGAVYVCVFWRASHLLAHSKRTRESRLARRLHGSAKDIGADWLTPLLTGVAAILIGFMIWDIVTEPDAPPPLSTINREPD